MANVAVDCGGLASCDNDDTGYKFYAGYKVHPQIAIEGGYIDFGKSNINVGSFGVGSIAVVRALVNAPDPDAAAQQLLAFIPVS